jgi:hypothetical protein
MEGYSFETDTSSELTSEAPLGAYEEGSFEAPSMDGFGELSGEGSASWRATSRPKAKAMTASSSKAKAILSSAASGAA